MAKLIRAEVAPVGLALDERLVLPANPSLARGEAHVWFVCLQEVRRHFGSLLGILAPEEVARATRFQLERDRNEYVLARGLLRHIVGCYVGFAPQLLRFRYNLCGKPALATEWGGDELAFNLSHSHGMVVYALTRAPHIGVDLECLHQNAEVDLIVERFFSPREASLFRQLPPDKKQEAFFSGWTRKEAYLKARGEGLWLDPRSFEVTFRPGDPPSLLSVAGQPSEIQRWSLSDLPVPAGYVAALVVEGIVNRIHHWQWPS